VHILLNDVIIAILYLLFVYMIVRIKQIIALIIKGTFKYHITLSEGVCSNRQSTDIWGERVWPNRHISLIVAKKG